MLCIACMSYFKRGAAMVLARYFLQQAERCYRLALACRDVTIARELNLMGDEFLNKAAEVSAAPPRSIAA